MVNTKIRLTIFFAAKDGEALYSKNKTGSCSDHELLIVKLRLKLKEVRKMTRPFRYDLNQIPHDYTESERKKVKSLSRVPLFVTPMDYSLSGSSIHEIFQVRVLECIAISLSRDLPDLGI